MKKVLLTPALGPKIILWLTRAIAAYMHTRDRANLWQRQRIEQWFYDNAVFTLEHMQSFLKLNFPDRERDDYTVKKGHASTADYLPDLRMTYEGDEIPRISQWYNNRRALAYSYLLFAGIAFRDIKPEFSSIPETGHHIQRLSQRRKAKRVAPRFLVFTRVQGRGFVGVNRDILTETWNWVEPF